MTALNLIVHFNSDGRQLKGLIDAFLIPFSRLSALMRFHCFLFGQLSDANKCHLTELQSSARNAFLP